MVKKILLAIFLLAAPSLGEGAFANLNLFEGVSVPAPDASFFYLNASTASHGSAPRWNVDALSYLETPFPVFREDWPVKTSDSFDYANFSPRTSAAGSMAPFFFTAFGAALAFRQYRIRRETV